MHYSRCLGWPSGHESINFRCSYVRLVAWVAGFTTAGDQDQQQLTEAAWFDACASQVQIDCDVARE